MALVPGSPIELHLIQGCYLEASRAEIVVSYLTGLCYSLQKPPHPHLPLVIDEIRISCHLLRELADYSHIHYTRVPVVLDYLQIILPCLSRSLRDIKSNLEDVSLSRENRWQTMYHNMTEEAQGLILPQRFILYNHFLTLLRELLTRSPNFDFNSMETARLKIMQLREFRAIPPPPIRVGQVIRPDAFLEGSGQSASTIHWSEQIFSLPLSSRTALKHQRPSESFGPHFPWAQLKTPSDAKILFVCPFDNHQISLFVFLNTRDRCPYFLLRVYHQGMAWFSVMGAHELCVDRDGSCLQFWRWSVEQQCATLWASLCCQTWEEMVLIYCSFLAFKTRNTLTLQIAPTEFTLSRERKLFQARINDDGHRHSLIVYEDQMTKGLRLHAAVWDGVFRQCPVWTAFVTHQSASSTWMKRISRCKIRLADIQIYVFSQKYQQQNQRRGHAGAFELNFVSEEASKRFKELFSPPPPSSEDTATLDSNLQS